MQLGSLRGQITTYVISGAAPFLLSRRVLEGMQATLDLGKLTITSKKHGMDRVPLKQASNGHLLLPLYPGKNEFVESSQCSVDQNELNTNKTKVVEGLSEHRAVRKNNPRHILHLRCHTMVSRFETSCRR